MTPITVTPTMRLLFLAVWLASGLVSSVIMMRHGHRHWYWLLLGMGLGPLAGLIFRERTEGDNPHVAEMRAGSERPGLHVLLAVDGSTQAERAARAALDLLNDAVGRVTVATVVDYDIDEGADGGPGSVTQARLLPVTSVLARWDPAEVVLAGPPVDALVDFARDHSVDLIVVGPRGRGLSRLVLGSVCVGLVSRAQPPVLVLRGLPEGPEHEVPLAIPESEPSCRDQ